MKTKMFLIGVIALLCFSCEPNPVINPEDPTTEQGDTLLTDTLFNYYANDSVLNLIFDRGNYKFMGMDYEQHHFYVIQSQEELDALCPEWVESPSIDFDTYCIVYASIITPSISDRLVEHELVYNRELDEYNLYITVDMAESAWGALGIFLPYGLYKIRYNQQPINLHVTINE